MALPLPAIRARIGLILPSMNQLSEPQFNRYAPEGVRIYCTRLRIMPREGAPIDDPTRIEEAALELADAGCELIVYHCTGTSMSDGVAGEQRLVDLITRATGLKATTTAGSIVAALHALGAHRIVFLGASNPQMDAEEAVFMRDAGFDVVGEHSMGLNSVQQFCDTPPAAWVEMAVKVADPRADAYFLACTTTQAPEALEDIESAVGRPAVSSNQAVLWNSLRMLGIADEVPELGQLLRLQTVSAGAAAAR